jgi:hypothetical protein
MALCSYICVLIAFSNGPAAALSDHNGSHGVQNRTAGPTKTKCLH